MRPLRISPERQRWMAVLAQASVDDLERAWLEVDDPPPYRVLRGWKRDRVAVRLDDGTTGEALPRAGQPVLAALFDALMQQPARRLVLEWELIAPLERLQKVAPAAGMFGKLLSAPSLED